MWLQISLEDFLESCGGVAGSSVGGVRTAGGPTLLGELEDDEDGVLAEEDDDNDENDQEVSLRGEKFLPITVYQKCITLFFKFVHFLIRLTFTFIY